MPTVPYRTHRVDDIAGGEPVALGDLCLAGLTATECAAFLKQTGPCGSVDGSIHPAAAK